MKCPACNRDVSPYLKSCPKCGQPIKPLDLSPSPPAASKLFGVLFIIASIALLVMGFLETQPGYIEQLTMKAQSTSESSLAAHEFAETLAGKKIESDDKSERNYSASTRELDRMKAGRNQKMLLFFGAAAVCLIVGVVCVKN